MIHDNSLQKNHDFSKIENDLTVKRMGAILAFFQWMGIPMLGGVAFFVGILIKDHFTTLRLVEDNRYMKPKVTRMWIKAHPNLTRDENSQE